MKRWFGAALALAAAASPLAADDFANNLAANLNTPALEALAQDLGAAAGAGSFHHGRALGHPLGLDLGVHWTTVRVSDDDAILKDDRSTLRPFWTQLEVGVPLNLNVIARYARLSDTDFYGGGLRWGVYSPSGPGLPSVSVAALYTVADHEAFDSATVSGNAIVSFDVPFIHPYVGAGYDRTRLEAGGMKVSKGGTRVEGGVNISVIPFTYFTLGGGWANGGALTHLGAGIRF